MRWDWQEENNVEDGGGDTYHSIKHDVRSSTLQHQPGRIYLPTGAQLRRRSPYIDQVSRKKRLRLPPRFKQPSRGASTGFNSGDQRREDHARSPGERERARSSSGRTDRRGGCAQEVEVKGPTRVTAVRWGRDIHQTDGSRLRASCRRLLPPPLPARVNCLLPKETRK